jgi:TatD DNase family protein
MHLYDTHCHLQDERLTMFLNGVLSRASAAGVTRMLCCGSLETDWPAVAKLALLHSAIRPAYGLHPWYLENRTPGWESLLRARLSAEPQAVLGEVGLDFAIKSPPRALQQECLVTQLNLAAELDRPVSIHCRKAWGALPALLRSLAKRPPALIFHSYSGDAELIPVLLRYNSYFSFSGSLTREGNRRGKAAAIAAPADRILLESDAPDLPPRQVPDGPNEPANMLYTLADLALCRGLTPEETAKLTWQNACKALGEAS